MSRGPLGQWGCRLRPALNGRPRRLSSTRKGNKTVRSETLEVMASSKSYPTACARHKQQGVATGPLHESENQS